MAEPLMDHPLVHRGRYWSMNTSCGITISGEEVARRLNARLPRELEDVKLDTLIELCIFRTLLELVNAERGYRLLPYKGMSDFLSKDRVIRRAHWEECGGIILGNLGIIKLRDSSMKEVMEIWADVISKAGREWKSELEKPMVIEKEGQSESTCRMEVATALLENRLEDLLNSRRIEWIKERTKADNNPPVEVIAAVLMLRGISKEVITLFTDKVEIVAGEEPLLVEIFRDEHPSVLTDFYLRNLPGPQYRGSIIWIDLSKVKSSRKRLHWRSIVDHMILSHRKGHWFYYVTQSRKEDALIPHEMIKEKVRPLGITEGAVVKDLNDEEGVYQWFTNLPINRQKGLESPEEIVNYLEDKTVKSWEQRIERLKKRWPDKKGEEKVDRMGSSDKGEDNRPPEATLPIDLTKEKSLKDKSDREGGE